MFDADTFPDRIVLGVEGDRCADLYFALPASIVALAFLQILQVLSLFFADM